MIRVGASSTSTGEIAYPRIADLTTPFDRSIDPDGDSVGLTTEMHIGRAHVHATVPEQGNRCRLVTLHRATGVAW
jgi:hypothetical protein